MWRTLKEFEESQFYSDELYSCYDLNRGSEHTGSTSNCQLNVEQLSIPTHHNVDHSTLSWRCNGGISKQEARVAQQLLSQKQELLVQWILDSGSKEYVPSHAQTREMAVLVSKVFRQCCYFGEPLGL